VASTNLKAVIFDLDGTLVVFNLDIKACRTKIIQFLMEQGFTQFCILNERNRLRYASESKKIPHNKSKQRIEI